jgi:multiple sugar transport system permease protein
MPKYEQRRWSGDRVREALTGFAYITPNFLGFLAFVSIPILVSFYFAFTEYSVLTPPKWVGLRNFKELLWYHYEDVPVFEKAETPEGKPYDKLVTKQVVKADGTVAEEPVTVRTWKMNDPNFWKFSRNTVYLMMGIPLGMAVSLSMALIMNQKIRGITFWRTVFFLPSVTAGVAVYLLWTWIYDPQQGLLNQFLSGALGWLHIGSHYLWPKDPMDWPRWIGSAAWAKPSLILMGLWSAAGGYNMILYLAALQGVDPQLYEAAMIDGANGWQKFWHVTWPLISPTTFFIVVMGIIGGFQGGFMQAYVMTEGGPQGSTTTLAYYIFNNAYAWFQMGKASTVAWCLFVVVFGLTLVNWRFGGKKVHY